jgi:hypothetical protein
MSLPFRAPVYTSYQQAIQGLYKQGYSSFYKGNLTRCTHFLLYHRLSADAKAAVQADKFGIQKPITSMHPLFQELALSCCLDMALHPFHLAEARLVMQNKSKNFRIYQGGFVDVWKRSPSEVFRGVMCHLPRNFFIALSKSILLTSL